MARDVAETLERVEKDLQKLRERHPGEYLLLVHLAYNWRVAQWLKEAGSGLVMPWAGVGLPKRDDVSVSAGPRDDP